MKELTSSGLYYSVIQCMHHERRFQFFFFLGGGGVDIFV
jgi:hypothetical protein